MIDHDRLFKELLGECFFDFIELFFPELAGYLDKDSITFLDKEVFTDVTAGERHEADLAIQARFIGRDSCFIVHVESHAQHPVQFGRRMFSYFARFTEKYDLPVYPIVVFSHDATRLEPDLFEVTFPDLEVLRFRYRVVQLSRLSWRDYLRKPNPVASALMAKMQMAPEERPRVKIECLRLLATLKLNPAKTRLISGFIDTYLRLTAAENLIFLKGASTMLDDTERSKVMQLTTSWKEEGIAEGLEQGLQQGLQRGLQQGLQRGLQQGLQQGRCQERQELVMRQLRRRFSLLDAALEERVRSVPAERLPDLAEALLDFRSLADLNDWLNLH